MDIKRKKQLIEEYKNRKPDMGILAFKFTETGDLFLTASQDIKADTNSNRFKMLMGGHPNKEMQKLWNSYGIDGLEIFVLKEYEYKNPSDDHTDKLEELLEKALEENTGSRRTWR